MWRSEGIKLKKIPKEVEEAIKTVGERIRKVFEETPETFDVLQVLVHPRSMKAVHTKDQLIEHMAKKAVTRMRRAFQLELWNGELPVVIKKPPMEGE